MRSLFSATFLCLSLTLNGQSLLQFKHYSVTNGLSQNRALSLLQDDNGYIWISTWNGLERFDGYAFQNFKTYPSDPVRMNNHRIIAIRKSSLNNIWCFTHNNSLYLFDTYNEKFEDVFRYNTQLHPGPIQEFFVLERGITWARGARDELYRIDENNYRRPGSVTLYENEEKNRIGDELYQIFQDADGDEWLLTNRGIAIVGDKPVHNRMPFMYVTETDHGIFLATRSGLVARYQPDGNIIPCPSAPGLSAVHLLEKTRGQQVVIGTAGGIVLYDTAQETYRHYDTHIEGRPVVCTSFFEDSRGHLWFLSDSKQVARLNPGQEELSFFSYTSEEEVVSHYIAEEFIHEDENGTVWIKPRDGDYCFYQEKSHTLQRAYRMEKDEQVFFTFDSFAHLIDTHSNLWYMNDKGFNYVSFSKKNYDYISDPGKSEARSFLEDHLRRFWVGWKPNSAKQPMQVSGYNQENRWLGNLTRDGKIVRDPKAEFGRFVYCMLEDADKNIWLGTKQDGLFRLQPQTADSYKVTQYLPDAANPYSLSSASVYSLIQDAQRRIWIGTYGGGLHLAEALPQGGGLRFIHAGNLLSNYPIQVCGKVRCLYECDNGVILIGTTDGLLCYSTGFDRPETIVFYHHTANESLTSLSNNDILNICQNRKGDLYITALSGGINRTDRNHLLSDQIQFEHFNKMNGLTQDFSMSVIEDRNGMLWIASENGLSSFDPETGVFEDYNRQVLKTDLEISEANPIRRGTGELIFGTVQGVFSITPDEIHKSDFVPPVVFSDIHIYLPGSYRKEPLHGSRKKVELGATERNIMVTFAALDYTHPEGIEYAYQITGLTDQWMHIGTHRSATFSGLPAGNYELRVKSTNGDGVWVDNETSLYIHVHPRFHETGWAALLYVLLALGLVVAITYIVLYIANLRHKVDFEQRLTHLKLRFFTDISHELRTPLTLIVNPIEETLLHEDLSEEGTENMRVARRNADRMLRLINQILDFRKIQNNKMKIYIEHTDVMAVLRQLCENFRSVAQQKNIDFRLECTTPELRIYTDVDKLEKIVFNLLSNAFKYTPDNRRIWLTVSSTEQHLLISVRDEGKGFHVSQAQKLFARFETNHTFHTGLSTGIGLSLVKELLGLLHGDISVESSLNKGSTFSVRLPRNYSAFTSDSEVEFILKDPPQDTQLPENKVQQVENGNVFTQKTAEKETTVLIIEDNDELRRFLNNILRREYTVLEASDGRQGWLLTQQEIPDVVISDIMIPGMDGIDYLRTVKENHNTSHIPVILLSAKASVEDRIQGLEYGADDYISKPFSSVYLKARIQSLLRQRRMLYDFYTGQIPSAQTSPHRIDPDRLAPSVPQVTHFDDEFIRKVVASVEEQMQNPEFRIDDLADAMGMSRTVFYRKLKAIVGLTPTDFVKSMRLKRALQLLDTDQYTISEVAYMCGFTTPQYFSKVFKDSMSCSPKEYKLKRDC